MGKILPVLMAVIGVAAGGGAGYLLRPAPVDEAPDVALSEPEAKAHDVHTEAPAHGTEGAEGDAGVEYVKLNNQFVVPVIKQGAVASLVVLSLSIEVTPGGTAKVYGAEPKIRDALLQVLFDHANSGGFDGDFTDAAKMADLRDALNEATRGVMGDLVQGVLISDIARQDTP